QSMRLTPFCCPASVRLAVPPGCTHTPCLSWRSCWASRSPPSPCPCSTSHRRVVHMHAMLLCCAQARQAWGRTHLLRLPAVPCPGQAVPQRPCIWLVTGRASTRSDRPPAQQTCPLQVSQSQAAATPPCRPVAKPAQAHLPLPACTRQSSSALPAEQPDAGQPPSPSQLSLPAASATHPGDPCCSAPPACTTTTATCSGERQQPSMAAGAEGPGYAASCSDALTGVLAILINSPLLASMATLHGNLMGIDSLNGSLDLFKRNGSSSSSSGSGLPQAAGSVLMSSHTSSKAAAQVLLQQG
ncbi:hypothetical protein V8C86DRAFT_2840211, partial [Haematococcus lacustris]